MEDRGIRFWADELVLDYDPAENAWDFIVLDEVAEAAWVPTGWKMVPFKEGESIPVAFKVPALSFLEAVESQKDMLQMALELPGEQEDDTLAQQLNELLNGPLGTLMKLLLPILAQELIKILSTGGFRLAKEGEPSAHSATTRGEGYSQDQPLSGEG